MSFEIQPGERPGVAARRLVGRQLEAVTAGLARPKDRGEAVHDARKRLKRARTVLRLVRHVIGDERYHRDQGVLRDVGRRLSAVRDAEVLVEALEAVGQALSAGTRNALLTELERRRGEALRRAFGPDDEPRRIARELAEVRTRMAEWPDGEPGWEPWGEGLARVYGQGRKAMRVALAEPNTERYHAWRKRTKDLWQLLVVVRPLWPAVLEPAAEEAHALADRLGEDHDLEVLRAALEGPARVSAGERAAIEEALRARSEVLRREATPLGLRLYAERPSAFAARLHGAWRAWTRDQ